MDLWQIPQEEALPRDIIILSDKNNYPKHAVMFDKVVNGDTLVNYSNGFQNLKLDIKSTNLYLYFFNQMLEAILL